MPERFQPGYSVSNGGSGEDRTTDSHLPSSGSSLSSCGRISRCSQKVTFVVQDDKPVGLDVLRVAFDDQRVVSDAAAMLVATLAGRLGIEALAGGWCGCVVTARRRQRWAQGDGAVVRDGAGRGQHR